MELNSNYYDTTVDQVAHLFCGFYQLIVDDEGTTGSQLSVGELWGFTMVSFDVADPFTLTVARSENSQPSQDFGIIRYAFACDLFNAFFPAETCEEETVELVVNTAIGLAPSISPASTATSTA